MPHATHIHSTTARQASEYLAGWQRARAELANFRRQVQQADHVAGQHQVRALLIALLAVADNFHAMTAHTPPELADHPWTKGVDVARQLDQLLAEYHVERVAAAGEKFDPTRHEAVGTVTTSAVPANHVVEVVQPGYVRSGQILRPARVTIAA